MSTSIQTPDERFGGSFFRGYQRDRYTRVLEQYAAISFHQTRQRDVKEIAFAAQVETLRVDGEYDKVIFVTGTGFIPKGTRWISLMLNMQPYETTSYENLKALFAAKHHLNFARISEITFLTDGEALNLDLVRNRLAKDYRHRLETWIAKKRHIIAKDFDALSAVYKQREAAEMLERQEYYKASGVSFGDW